MIQKFQYISETRSFADRGDRSKREIALIIGTAAAVKIIPAVIKAIVKTKGSKIADELLVQRNNRLNRLTDNYNIKGLDAKTDKATVEAYKKEIHNLYEETLRILKTRRDIYENKEADLYINVNQDQYGSTRSVSRTPKDKDTILFRYIDPFIVVLKMILVRGIHVLPGTMLGADRRNFELVFDPDHSNPDDVARNSFRTIIFRHPWPSHGFEVTTRGETDANKLINNCIDFLAENPKYLAIRV